jgi:hypothetical protein
MSRGAIWCTANIRAHERKLDAIISLHEELNIPVLAIKLLQELVHNLWSMMLYNKFVIDISKTVGELIGCLIFEIIMNKVAITGDGTKPIATPFAHRTLDRNRKKGTSRHGEKI